MKNKIIIGVGTTAAIGTAAVTTAVVINKKEANKKDKEENRKIIKTELTEEVATDFYNRLIALRVSPGRANMLINEVDLGHLKPEQLEDMIENWDKL